MRPPARRNACGALLLSLALIAPRVSAEVACPRPVVAPTVDQLLEAFRNARDRGALWRVEKDGWGGFLYGTIHIANLDWAMPGPTVWQALPDAETIAVEVNIARPATNAAMTAPQESHETPSLSARLMERLREQAVRACEPSERLAGMPPLMIVAKLALLAARGDGLNPDYAIDAVSTKRAHSTSGSGGMRCRYSQPGTLRITKKWCSAAILRAV